MKLLLFPVGQSGALVIVLYFINYQPSVQWRVRVMKIMGHWWFDNRNHQHKQHQIIIQPKICGRRKFSWIFICKWMQEIIWDRGNCQCCRDMVCCCLIRNNNQRLASIQQNKSDQTLAFFCRQYNTHCNLIDTTKDINEQDATINRRWRICELGKGQIINFNISFKDYYDLF
jgi:hypothetical protein